MKKKVTVETTYTTNLENYTTHLSLRVSLPYERMRVALDRLSHRVMIEQHRQREQTHEHYRLEGTITQYVSDISVETGDVLLLTVWKEGSLYTHAVWEVTVGESVGAEQLLFPGDEATIELYQSPEEG